MTLARFRTVADTFFLRSPVRSSVYRSFSTALLVYFHFLSVVGFSYLAVQTILPDFLSQTFSIAWSGFLKIRQVERISILEICRIGARWAHIQYANLTVNFCCALWAAEVIPWDEHCILPTTAVSSILPVMLQALSLLWTPC